MLLVVFRPKAGDHKYKSAPDAVNDIFSPSQMVDWIGLTATNGNGLTIIVIVSKAIQLLISIPVTVYVKSLEGIAETILPMFVFKEDDGDHTYEVAPVALKIDDSCKQIVSSEALTDIIGLSETVTKRLVSTVHPKESETKIL